MSYVQASQDLKVHPTQLGNWVIRGALPWSRSDEARAARDRAAQARGHEAEGRARHPKKAAAYTAQSRIRIRMFITRHMSTTTLQMTRPTNLTHILTGIHGRNTHIRIYPICTAST